MAVPAPKIQAPKRLIEDTRLAAASMSPYEARKLVKAYWRIQESRIATDLSVKDVEHPLLDFFTKGIRRMENQIKRAFEIYVDQSVAGRWAISNPGVGPIISGSLLSLINLDKCGESVSALWRYAGLDPTAIWVTKAEIKPKMALLRYRHGDKISDKLIKNLCKSFNKNEKIIRRHAKRYGNGEITFRSLESALMVKPYNPYLKEACYHLGLGIRRMNNTENYMYGQLYKERLAYEYEMNSVLAYEDQAIEIFRNTNWKDIGEGSISNVYKEGKLPPFHIESRARRWITKLFMSHFHEILFYEKYERKPKKPYILTVNDEATEISCPNWPFKL